MNINLIKTLDKEIFTLLREQAIEVFTFLLVMREFAIGKGLQNDVERINDYIAENKQVLSVVNNQLYDLKKFETKKRMGFFDTIKTCNTNSYYHISGLLQSEKN